jgi:predicted acetyltransferase
MTELLVRSLQPHDLDKAGDLVARVFSRGDARRYERLLYQRVTHLPHKPGFHPNDYRAGFLNGEMVAVARMEQHTLFYGSARLRVAVISDIATDPAYRHRGYSGAIIRDMLTYTAEQGAYLALLYDTTEHYHKYGFSPIFPDYRLAFDVERAAQLPTPLAAREAVFEDMPFLAALYQQHWEGRLSFRRSPESWLWRVQASPLTPVVVVEPTGKVAGYLWRSDEADELTEVVADTPEATMTLMNVAAYTARQTEAVQVNWLVPPDDAIAAFANQFIPITLSASYHPGGGWMARLINATVLVNTLLPEICAQAQFTDASFDPDRLVFDVQPAYVAIAVKHDRASACKLAHRDFIQVMFGSLRPATLALRTHLSMAQVQLLEMLFPPRMAAIAGWDW